MLDQIFPPFSMQILEETLKELAGIVAARLARRQHRERLGFHD
jgi:hypothetical protein